MPLSNICNRAIELNTTMGVTSQPKAVSAALGALKGDPESIEEACHIAVVKVIHDKCTRTLRQPPSDPRQASLFQLHTRYAVDANARVFKDTERLSQFEFQRILALRRKQIEDDTEHLNNLEEAYKEVCPIWQEYPDKLFGEVEQIYIRRRRAA